MVAGAPQDAEQTVAALPVEPARPAAPRPPPRTSAANTTVGTKPSPPAAMARPPASVAVAPAPAPPATKVPAPAVAPRPSAPPLDLAALEARLRETRAIGVFTKLSLKNQVDDLLNKFRAYYKRQAKTTLAELRRPYDMLLLKVLSLLQDSDPPLARDIVASREAIWGILSDPQKFNEARLMAGETP
jgi:hypothetical protein